MKRMIVSFLCFTNYLQVESATLSTELHIQDIDTAIIDASDIFLTIQFDYVEGDIAKSNALLKQQHGFLRLYGMPISGAEEMLKNSLYDFRLVATL